MRHRGRGFGAAHTAEPDALGQMQAELRRLPRHQWDSYLWEFCLRFVQRPAAAPEDSSDVHGARAGSNSSGPAR